MAERKKFMDIEVPILNQTIQVLGTPKDVVGKTIKLDLSRKLRGKGLIIVLQVFNHNERIIAVPKRMDLMKSYLRRIIRKRTDNVEDSFLAHCSDIRATIKPFLITRKKVSRAVRKNLRNTAKEFLVEYLKKRTYYEACSEILEGTLQREMLPKLKKVYPLAFCELRVFETKDLAKIDFDLVLSNSTDEDDQEVEISQEESSDVEEKPKKESKKKSKEDKAEEEDSNKDDKGESNDAVQK